jgi:predicted nucleotidyltransferase
MNDRELLRQRFRRNLYKYVNGEFLSRKDILISMIAPSIPYLIRSRKICRQYEEVFFTHPEEISSNHVKIGVYKGKNSHVLQMMNHMSELKDDLCGAYLHGSLGTYEEVTFSDFDALVIIKEEVFKIPERLAEVARKLNSAQTIMFDFDPLQHHGWFVLTEADLKSYPEDYFPVELFRHAKSLMTDQGMELMILTQDSSQSIRRSFDNLVHSINTLIRRNKSYRNLYLLKILLSQFMLLPALYVEIRDGKGIYKKFSFEEAQVDFDGNDWSIMEEVSLIREKWHFERSSLWLWLMTKPIKTMRSIARAHSPAVPPEIKVKLTEDFFRKMSNLTLLMQKKINETNF